MCKCMFMLSKYCWKLSWNQCTTRDVYFYLFIITIFNDILSFEISQLYKIIISYIKNKLLYGNFTIFCHLSIFYFLLRYSPHWYSVNHNTGYQNNISYIGTQYCFHRKYFQGILVKY